MCPWLEFPRMLPGMSGPADTGEPSAIRRPYAPTGKRRTLTRTWRCRSRSLTFW